MSTVAAVPMAAATAASAPAIRSVSAVTAAVSAAAAAAVVAVAAVVAAVTATAIGAATPLVLMPATGCHYDRGGVPLFQIIAWRKISKRFCQTFEKQQMGETWFVGWRWLRQRSEKLPG
jgi:hypothetical protein